MRAARKIGDDVAETAGTRGCVRLNVKRDDEDVNESQTGLRGRRVPFVAARGDPAASCVAAVGAVCYGRGLCLHHTQPRATAWCMRRLVQRLLHRARRSGRNTVLVLDRGNPNHARSLHRDLEMAEPLIEVLWLPHYARLVRGGLLPPAPGPIPPSEVSKRFRP